MAWQARAKKLTQERFKNMKKNAIYALVGVAAITAVAGSSLVSFAAKPDFAGKDVTKEERRAAIQEMVDAKQADKTETKEEKSAEQAQKSIDKAEALSAKLQEKAAELGITVPSETLSSFNALMLEAQAALTAGDYKLAKQKANEAKGVFAELELLIDAAEADEEEVEEPVV
jgi:hypothetical protein